MTSQVDEGRGNLETESQLEQSKDVDSKQPPSTVNGGENMKSGQTNNAYTPEMTENDANIIRRHQLLAHLPGNNCYLEIVEDTGSIYDEIPEFKKRVWLYDYDRVLDLYLVV